jgi:hypothetical protein
MALARGGARGGGARGGDEVLVALATVGELHELGGLHS